MGFIEGELKQLPAHDTRIPRARYFSLITVFASLFLFFILLVREWHRDLYSRHLLYRGPVQEYST